MNATTPRIAGPIESAAIMAFAVGMPLLWWAPKESIVIAAIPIWAVLTALAAIARKKKSERHSQAMWLSLACIVGIYLGYAVLAFFLRK